MSQEKIKQLKLFIQGAAAQAAQDFYRLDQVGGDEHFGRCGACEVCQQSLDNLARLFKRSMEREIGRLAEKDFERVLEGQMTEGGLSREEAEARLRATAADVWGEIVPHIFPTTPPKGLN